MRKTKVIAIFAIVLLLSCTFYNCYAETVAVTKENLNIAIQKYASSEMNEDDAKFTVDDDIINIKTDENEYVLSYDLTQKPTFTSEIPIKEGMSYAEYSDKIENIRLPMIGYVAVANIQGVEIKNASKYFLLTYLANALNGSLSSGDSYTIYDDTQTDDSVTIDKVEKTILVSEFGERVMEYVNATYKEKMIIKDEFADENNSYEFNSYELTIERKDVTATSCTLVSSLSVNLDADFSKLNGYDDKMNNMFLNKDITRENADYVIDLKVGQKCIISTDEKLSGYELSGSGYEYNKIDDNSAEIIGEKVGKANGYIYIGDIKKSVFITVEENTENTTLNPISIKMNATKDDKNSEDKNTIVDDTTARDNIPQTGTGIVIYIAMMISVISIIAVIIKLNKYKEI